MGLGSDDYLACWYGMRVGVDVEGFIFGAVTPLVASVTLILSGVILRTTNAVVSGQRAKCAIVRRE